MNMMITIGGRRTIIKKLARMWILAYIMRETNPPLHNPKMYSLKSFKYSKRFSKIKCKKPLPYLHTNRNALKLSLSSKQSSIKTKHTYEKAKKQFKASKETLKT